MRERAHPEAAQHRFGGGHQAEVGGTAEHGDADGYGEGQPAGTEGERGVEAVAGENPSIEDLLDEHGDDDATDGVDDCHEHGDPKANTQLGTRRQATAEHRDRATGGCLDHTGRREWVGGERICALRVVGQLTRDVVGLARVQRRAHAALPDS